MPGSFWRTKNGPFEKLVNWTFIKFILDIKKICLIFFPFFKTYFGHLENLFWTFKNRKNLDVSLFSMIGEAYIAAGITEFETLGKGPVGQRYKRFVLLYVADPKRNATRAYREVFGTKSYDSARANASKLLTKPNILAAINAIQNRVRETALDRILNKLEAIIHTELRDVMEWGEDGQVKIIPSAKLSPAASAALSQIQEVREEKQQRLPGMENAEEAALNIIRRCVKLHDPLRAIEVYAKLAGIGGAERVEVTGIAESIKAAWSRVSKAEAGAQAGGQ